MELGRRCVSFQIKPALGHRPGGCLAPLGRGDPGLGISKAVWFEKDGITWCRVFAPRPPPYFQSRFPSPPWSFGLLVWFFAGLATLRLGPGLKS